eukprot:gene747-925_t
MFKSILKTKNASMIAVMLFYITACNCQRPDTPYKSQQPGEKLFEAIPEWKIVPIGTTQLLGDHLTFQFKIEKSIFHSFQSSSKEVSKLTLSIQANPPTVAILHQNMAVTQLSVDQLNTEAPTVSLEIQPGDATKVECVLQLLYGGEEIAGSKQMFSWELTFPQKTITFITDQNGNQSIPLQLDDALVTSIKSGSVVSKKKASPFPSPFDWEQQETDWERIKQVVQNSQFRVNGHRDWSVKAMCKAISNHKDNIVIALINKGFNCSSIPLDEYVKDNALHLAARAGASDTIIQHLLDQQVPLEATDIHGYTPLHTAVLHGHLSVVRYLISKGADIHQLGYYQQSSLELAIKAFQHQKEMILLLLTHGADINQQNQRTGGNTILHRSVRSNNLALVQFLLKKGADCHIKNQTGETALDIATKENNQEIITLLQKSMRPITTDKE